MQSLAFFACKHHEDAYKYGDIATESFTKSVQGGFGVITGINYFHMHDDFPWSSAEFMPKEHEIAAHEQDIKSKYADQIRKKLSS